MIGQPRFRDRVDAGRQLAAALAHLRLPRPLVLALPRGGVPVAWEVARALGADLDLLFVRKIGAPQHEELGLGAVIDGAEPQLVLNDEVVRLAAPDPGYIRAEVRRQLAEIERRRHAYTGGREPIAVTGRTVVIVDDGIATGGTIRAAVRGVRKNGPARLVIAVPVAAQEAVETLRPACDELVCLELPHPFVAVGEHYADFTQVSDAEVTAILAEADGHAPAGGRSAAR